MKKVFKIVAIILIGTFIFGIINSIANIAIGEKLKVNKLASEKSPYLLQHKNNPVNWYPWGKEAFEKAKAENKPIFLSIGYSTCYWCHVMEKDSFELEEVAEVLNKHFIAIKVDREERPDVDQIYMDAVIAMSGHGGWPLSAFLTPDRRPFFGGTFFWKDQFISVLNQIHNAWTNEKEKVLKSAESLTQHISAKPSVPEDGEIDDDVFRKAIAQLTQRFDSRWGGFGDAPKFPPSETLSFLLRLHRRSANPNLLKMVELTLEKMAYGGMYDHLGGGFARYSTDEKWLVPHFEKMLYDNALLSNVYLEAYQVTKKDFYKDVATETLDYVLRDMTSDKGGFYSAEDAGEVDKEGEFYVWKFEVVKEILTEAEFKEIQKLYGLSKEGNFEHNNILNLQEELKWSDKNSALAKSASKKLLLERDKRTRPHKDDKVLTSWNGLMIRSMAKAYQVLGDKRYLRAAQNSAKFIEKNLYKDGELLRRYRDGEAKIAAVLDDYAFLILGLIELYQSDFDEHWLRLAIKLQDKQDELFLDKQEGGYFFSRDSDKSLIVRKKDLHDGALPSGNAISARNLLQLKALTFEERYRETAKDIFNAMGTSFERYPSGLTSALSGLDFFFDASKEVVVVGHLDSKEASEFKKKVRENFLPSKVLAYGKATSFEDESGLIMFRGKQVLNNKTTIYVCENNTCKAPTNDPEKAFKEVDSFKAFK